ncbi:hypothetical protein ACFXA8_37965, partial [Streptomyces sp. NPDC059409]
GGAPRARGAHRAAPGDAARPRLPAPPPPGGGGDGRRLATKVSAATLRCVFGAVLLAVAVAMGTTAVL